MSQELRAVFAFSFPGALLFLAAVGFLRPHGLALWCQGPVAALPYLALGFGLGFGCYFANTRMILSSTILNFADQRACGMATAVLPFLLQPFPVVWSCDPAHEDVAIALGTAYILGWPMAWTPVRQPAVLAFMMRRCPVGGSICLAEAANGRRGGVGAGRDVLGLSRHASRMVSDKFFATAGVIIFVSLVQATYQETYRDHLTGIP